MALEWDPNPIFWTIPGINLAVAWYGILFAAGFVCGYLVMRRLMTRHFVPLSESPRAMASLYTDRILWCCVIGTLVGARLGYVLFYGLPFYLEHPMEVFNFRAGGLASHGGAVGVFLSLLIFRFLSRRKFPSMSLLRILDTVVAPIALTGAFIRLGNFFNQEIVGTASTLPWAITFLHPADGLSAIARHPAQLYECFAYLLIFGLLFRIGLLTRLTDRVGLRAGLFFIGVFGFRFIVEFVKERTGQLLSPDSLLSMGQLLSIPFILIGLGLLAYSLSSKRSAWTAS
jgi:phosphatidylglycerol---prolipoprotein diacylglyceryl transferase